MLFCVSANWDSPPNYTKGGVTYIWHFSLYSHSGCIGSGSSLVPIPDPKAQMAGARGMETHCLSWALVPQAVGRREPGSSEALPAGLCPVRRHRAAECSPSSRLRNQKCQLARSNQHKEHRLMHRVNRRNALLQTPVHAQTLQGFKI